MTTKEILNYIESIHKCVNGFGFDRIFFENQLLNISKFSLKEIYIQEDDIRCDSIDIDDAKVNMYLSLNTEFPAIIIGNNGILDGNHRAIAAMKKGKKIKAYFPEI